ncbi:MAG: carboxylating nicotinate-nucleotide diphosphorylase [Chloroflexi bacterium]|nr:carboxylating nicotinate-nucleotide diphosphorylase [Chloroflexota bacterium]
MESAAQPCDPVALRDAVTRALLEDRAWHDVTTRAVVPVEQQGSAVMRVREPGVVCGLEAAREAFAQLSEDLVFVALAPDGSSVEAGEAIAEVSGPLAPLLSAERVALNFVQRLSGIATLTRRLVERAAEGGPAQLVDTRKTTPGLRDLERYAVRVGGARNHRNTLEDGVLIKDNHVAAAAARGVGVAELVQEARMRAPHTLRVEVEVSDAAGALVALAADADVILLDNMSPEAMRQVVESAERDRVLFEASGGITLETVREVAATGVHLISSGALTHSAPALDVALDIEAS